MYATRMANDFNLGPEMAAAIAADMKKQVEKSRKGISSGELKPMQTIPQDTSENNSDISTPLILRGKKARNKLAEIKKLANVLKTETKNLVAGAQHVDTSAKMENSS